MARNLRLIFFKTKVFSRSRLPGALNGPQDRQKTIQDEKPVLGKVSRPQGADVAKKKKDGGVWQFSASGGPPRAPGPSKNDSG